MNIKSVLAIIFLNMLMLSPLYASSLKLLPAPDEAKFIDPDFFIWGGSMLQGDDGKYHLFYSRWPKELGHNAWLTHSEIAHAVADSPLGPFSHKDIALPKHDPKHWDGLVTHNPTVHRFGDKYYLYYMGNTGDGKPIKGYNWSHRNNQRIGVAIADSPNGPWRRQAKPVIDVGEESDWDALLTSNPSVAKREDGSFILVYKAVAKKLPLPAGGPVVHLVATSNSPLGPFVKYPDPVFVKEGEKFPAEDPFIWAQDGKLHAIVKDMHGAFTDAGRSLVLFESEDGLDWALSNNPLLTKTEVKWQNGELQPLAHLERPQLWIENGIPKVLFLAADENRQHSFNVHIPIQQD